MKSSIKTGDTVKIIAGANKGKSGKVLKVDREKNLAMIEGIGVRERHIRASYLNPKGGKKEIHVGINISNLKKEEGKK
ncbi:KOW motif-containing protein [Candidatus Saccharibacteria bacterium]|nr:KOW motif-containing protein [Candidatus Saccharibacteria bacterium]